MRQVTPSLRCSALHHQTSALQSTRHPRLSNSVINLHFRVHGMRAFPCAITAVDLCIENASIENRAIVAAERVAVKRGEKGEGKI